MRMNLGFFLLGFAVVTMAITWKSYRNGEKWAWYLLLLFPLILGLTTVTNLVAGGIGWQVTIVLVIVSLVGLLLPIRKFFPKS